ncbi:Monoacylglycerol lipase ABHD12-like protein [Hapsidospora chrysogenum ATCC 11550]|uniref:Monoacylglycerol lipase ABHD12-like protein n=1 Tax=Hapsidospora chrysogenum (strain ATCC 11550 / CBS 779.69 / DSM 880 / IAM 14645 / JCM 23072 / IMI 49137) TaxID=857340 RepID=A0A086TF72_HAPC1|nr:Monoacylglycerol lipase ABHD12-like protein [Hapsidospora chrysogenum ATCC 11550]
MSVTATALQSVAYAVAGAVASYFAFVALLTVPFVQNQVIYLNNVTLTWFKDVNYPEQWGFLHNQVTPFHLRTGDGETLHAWHILPPGLWQQHAEELIQEPAGLTPDITARKSFELLRDDPDALLVLYFHGAAGTLGSGHRPPSYKAIYGMEPNRIHTVAIDYRGFGTSTGSPSEQGLKTDALTLARWAMNEAKIPPERIVLFGQSLGTAVAVYMANHYAKLPEPVHFSGLVLVAPFADVELLTATYRVAGTIPLLEPVAKFPKLLAYLNRFIRDKWPTKDRLAEFIRLHEEASSGSSGSPRPGYWVSILHGEDDYDIPWAHSEQLFWHAVNATEPAGISFEELEKEKPESRVDMGAGGWAVERRTARGLVKEQILKNGLHDRIMGYPAVSLAIYGAFHHGREPR